MTNQNLTRGRVIEVARSWTGTPYHHQASLKQVGADCLGLVRGVWREIYGYDAASPPAYSADWAEASKQETLLMAARRYLRPVAIEDMQPGDVLVFRFRDGLPAKHTGILVSPSTMVHAAEGGPATEIALAPWWRRRIAGAFLFPGLTDEQAL